MIISMEYKDIKGVLVWISLKDSSVALFFLFISFSLFSLFLYFLCGLNGSFYLTLICPLWDLLLCPLWDLFLTYGQHSILQEGKGDLSHFTRYRSEKRRVGK